MKPKGMNLEKVAVILSNTFLHYKVKKLGNYNVANSPVKRLIIATFCINYRLFFFVKRFK